MGRRSRRDDRGAVLPMVAVMVSVLVIFAAFAVDLGMQRVARRDMQALADIVALDLSRLVDGRTAAQIQAGDESHDPLGASMQRSVDRNADSTLGQPPDVTATLVMLDPDGKPIRDASGALTAVSGSAVPAAVVVEARTEVEFAFATGSGGASRSAVGVSESNACFRLGSFAASLDSSNSPLLNTLVGDALDLTAVGYDGLVDADVSLLGLATELGAGSVDELLALDSLSLHTLYLASARALERQGGAVADVELLEDIAARVDGSLQIAFSDLLDLSSAGDAALRTDVNLLDLVAASALVANGENFLDLPVLWNVPQFSNGVARLRVIQKPQAGCGRVGEARAQTAQIMLEARPDLNVPQIAGLSAVTVPVSLVVELASAEGVLTGATCGEGTTESPESVTVRVDRSLVSKVHLSIPIHLTGEIGVSKLIKLPSLWGLGSLLNDLLNVKATVDLTINAGVSTIAPNHSDTATYAVPPHDYTDPEPVGDGSSGPALLPTVTLDAADVSGTITVSGSVVDVATIDLASAVDLQLLFDDLVNKNVLSGINGFIANVNQVMVPLTELLGVGLAGADLFGVPRPTCNNPSLRG